MACKQMYTRVWKTMTIHNIESHAYCLQGNCFHDRDSMVTVSQYTWQLCNQQLLGKLNHMVTNVFSTATYHLSVQVSALSFTWELAYCSRQQADCKWMWNWKWTHSWFINVGTLLQYLNIFNMAYFTLHWTWVFVLRKYLRFWGSS